MYNNGVAPLFRLQESEKRLTALAVTRKEASEVTAVNELNDRLEKFSKVRNVVRNRLQRAEKSVRALELSLATAEEGRDTVKNRMYGGEVTGSKELAQLEGRLQGLLTEVDTLEGEVLGALEAVDELKEQLNKVEAGAAKTTAQMKAAEDRLAHRQSEWDLQEEMLRLECEQLRAEADPALLSLYDRKKAATRGEPVALIQHGVCGGCRMELPASIRATHGRELSTCEQCGRLLYWPE